MANTRKLLPHELGEEGREDGEPGSDPEAEADLPAAVPVCAFGQVRRPGLRGYHCIECMKWGLKMARDFRQGVEMGWWDEEGYKPAERRAQRRKQEKAQV